MARTSKKQFDHEFKREIWESFRREIARARVGANVENFLHKFLTENERVMLEKRLAVLHFLKRGVSLRETSRRADVSRKTVIFIKRGLKKNGSERRSYEKLYKKTPRAQRHRMPVYKGKGRWDFLRNY